MTTQLKTQSGRARRRAVTADELRVLAHPLRQEMVDLLAANGGEADVAELAEQSGRPADGLYYHLDLLCESGLVHHADGDGPRRYRLDLLPGERMELDYARGCEHPEALADVLKAALDQGRRDVLAALKRDDVVRDGPRRELWAGRIKGWVGRDELAEINLLLQRLHELLSRARDPGEARRQLVSMTFALAPVPAKPKRRLSKGRRAASDPAPPRR